MEDQTTLLFNAQEQCSQYLQHIDEALAAGDTDEMRELVQEAIDFGQNALDHIADAEDRAGELGIDHDVTEVMDEAMLHLGLSIDQGNQALDASDEEIEDYISEMRRHAAEAMVYTNEAMV